MFNIHLYTINKAMSLHKTILNNKQTKKQIQSGKFQLQLRFYSLSLTDRKCFFNINFSHNINVFF